MHMLGLGLTGFVAVAHVWFFVLESFLWKKLAPGLFHEPREKVEATAVMAQNQGVYNLFLAAGLVWALAGDPAQLLPRATFFLGCVIVAGIVGAATASIRILYIQAAPAVLALVFLRLA